MLGNTCELPQVVVSNLHQTVHIYSEPAEGHKLLGGEGANSNIVSLSPPLFSSIPAEYGVCPLLPPPLSTAVPVLKRVMSSCLGLLYKYNTRLLLKSCKYSNQK